MQIWAGTWMVGGALAVLVTGCVKSPAVTGPADHMVKRGLAYASGTNVNKTNSCVAAQIGVTNQAGLCVLDRELRYLKTASSNQPPRPAPIVPDPLHPPVPFVPSPMTSPYIVGVQENVYFSSGGALTANVYREPGKPWVVHLGIISPGLGDTKEGAKCYRTWYRISTDEGKTFGPLKPVILKGDGYNLAHPVKGVWVATNSYAVDETRPIIRASNGEIMVPFGYWPLKPDGSLYLPAHGWTYWDSGVLIGRWIPDGSDMEWTMGAWLGADPKRMPVGLEEPTIVELRTPGEFLLVARGGNNGTDLPGRKWTAISRDYCRTWSKVEPFTYTDGEPLLSPGACSMLLRSRKNGRIYWIGNIAEEPTRADSPRYPLMIGEVDEKSHSLIRESLLVLDTRQPEYDSQHMQLSNFHVYEDPGSGRLTVTLSRYDKVYDLGFAKSGRLHGPPCWYLVGIP
ncbi:MAG: sialidase family protein [Verrucomicrobia bacterium]|nr:sialidase family protein [Verrucomicrobiota bacterium]